MRSERNSLSFIFLTAVVKLYHICQKALSHIWKSFTTIVKKLEYNEKQGRRITIIFYWNQFYYKEDSILHQVVLPGNQNSILPFFFS